VILIEDEISKRRTTRDRLPACVFFSCGFCFLLAERKVRFCGWWCVDMWHV